MHEPTAIAKCSLCVWSHKLGQDATPNDLTSCITDKNPTKQQNSHISRWLGSQTSSRNRSRLRWQEKDRWPSGSHSSRQPCQRSAATRQSLRYQGHWEKGRRGKVSKLIAQLYELKGEMQSPNWLWLIWKCSPSIVHCQSFTERFALVPEISHNMFLIIHRGTAWQVWRHTEYNLNRCTDVNRKSAMLLSSQYFDQQSSISRELERISQWNFGNGQLKGSTFSQSQFGLCISPLTFLHPNELLRQKTRFFNSMAEVAVFLRFTYQSKCTALITLHHVYPCNERPSCSTTVLQLLPSTARARVCATPTLSMMPTWCDWCPFFWWRAFLREQ